MKIFDIAIKDMTRSFRSLFALMFMFGVPLLMATMFYFMFGGLSQDGTGYSLPATKVVVANLDQGGPGFEAARAQFPAALQANSMGDVIVSILQDKGFADLMQVTLADSAEAARAAVDSQEAGVAIIIPADFSEQFSSLSGQATIEMYKDPTLTLGPGIVQSIMSQLMDGMSGAKVAVDVAVKQTGSSNPQLIGQVVQQYMAASPSGDQASALVAAQVPASSRTPTDPLNARIGMILGGMTVFYAFFTGASTAQSLLKEEEEGTLPRLFTTPTARSTILGGKFLAIGLTVIVQMAVLYILGPIIFGIHWGSLWALVVATVATVLGAAGFGIFLMSLLKSVKQSGAVFGGILTVTGMMGMINIFTMGAISNPTIDRIALFVPQGWATRALLQVMNGAALSDVALTALVLAAIGAALFLVGVLRFQKRYA
jgi:ABC-2 type transport system permease protein